MKQVKTNRLNEILLEGQPVSPGIAIGTAYILSDEIIETSSDKISSDRIDSEISRYKNAINDVKRELRQILDQVGGQLSSNERDIFDFNLMILDDPQNNQDTIDLIKDQQIEADHAYLTVMKKYQRSLKGDQNAFFRERAMDIKDIKRRVIRKIQGESRSQQGTLKDAVIAAQELSIFDLRRISKENVAGILLAGGGRTSHITIMIRALELPAIIGIEELWNHIQPGCIVTLNGMTGQVIINPSASKKRTVAKLQTKFLKLRKEYESIARKPSVTLDGKPFAVKANVEIPEDIDNILSHGKFGIGLYRTEYDFIDKDSVPTEEELYEIYVNAIKKIHPQPVTIRTIDIGGDKIASFVDSSQEKNPFLGWRAMRICLDQPDLFKKQLRAILRASAWGNVRLMFPLISTINEIRKAKAHLLAVMQQLRVQGIEFNKDIPVGIMIEVPSAALMADQIAREVDFFSIGTNDLVQYTLAVDRTNARVAKYYNFFAPSVLRLIKMTVKAGRKQDIPVGLCGEMAGDPLATILLLGLGITEFSVSPVMLLEINQILRSLRSSEAYKVSQKCLRLQTAQEISDYLREVMTSIFPKMDEDIFYRKS